MTTYTELKELKREYLTAFQTLRKLQEKHDAGAKGKDGFPIAGWFDEGILLRDVSKEAERLYNRYNEAAKEFYGDR